MKEICITDIDGVLIGHAQDYDAMTGCTAIICPDGAQAGVEVRGGGPASRETELLDPVKNCQAIHCVMLSGGSAYGLAAGDGAMQWLEEKGIGYQLGEIIVPLVCGASIFDLMIGDSKVRPDKAMGYQACDNAGKDPAQGSVGAGTGATVGKLTGAPNASKSGLGIFAAEINGVKCGAVAVVNALGEVYEDGKIIAGIKDGNGGFISSSEVMLDNITAPLMPNRANTTLVCIITNAQLTKDEANKVAQTAHNGFARAIRPVHTSMDGDLAFCLSTGEIYANPDAVGEFATEVTRRAIVRAAQNAENRL